MGDAATITMVESTDDVRAARALRLPHEPALDGLRGVAVVAVLAFHMNRLEGGFLGVDLFFVLSGFLITSLLLSEARERGRIDLRVFWSRRARRLLPALWLLVVGVAGLLLVYSAADERPLFRDDALATLGYIANWQRLTETTSYWDIFRQPSPFDHMWSLAIEEQFYIAWPLVAALLLRGGGHVRRVGWVAGIGAVVSLAWLALTYRAADTTWAYYSTPTRLGPTLLGAALAAATIGRSRRDGPPGVRWELAAVVAAAVMAVSLLTIDGIDPTYYRGGLAVFAVAACMAIRAVTGGPRGHAARLLSLAPARWMGTISYGVYLWHWPVFVYLTTDRVPLDRWAVDALRLGLTLALAVLSFVLVEQPIRRGALRGRRLYASTAGVLALTTGAVLVATSGEARPLADANAKVNGGTLADADLEGIDNPLVAVPFEADIPDDAVRLLLVGDSGAGALGPDLVDEAPTIEADPPVAAAFESQFDCSIVWADGPTRPPDGKVIHRDHCGDDREAAWEHILDEFEPDVVAYYLANAGFRDEHLVDGEWVRECTPTYDTYLEEALIAEAELLSRDGAEIVFFTSPYLGFGPPEMNDAVDCRNATIRRAAAAHPGTRVLDLHTFIHATWEAGDTNLFKDPVHLSPHGARVVTAWLVPQVSAIRGTPGGPGR